MVKKINYRMNYFKELGMYIDIVLIVSFQFKDFLTVDLKR